MVVGSFSFWHTRGVYWSSSESQSLAILFTTLTGPDSFEVSGIETGVAEVGGGAATICGDITTIPGCIIELAGTNTWGPQVCCSMIAPGCPPGNIGELVTTMGNMLPLLATISAPIS